MGIVLPASRVPSASRHRKRPRHLRQRQTRDHLRHLRPFRRDRRFAVAFLGGRAGQRITTLFRARRKIPPGPPSVKYRGIFLNDEAPDLSGWVQEKFGTVPPGTNPRYRRARPTMAAGFYTNLFELILRSRAITSGPPCGTTPSTKTIPIIPCWRTNMASSWELLTRNR